MPIIVATFNNSFDQNLSILESINILWLKKQMDDSSNEATFWALFYFMMVLVALGLLVFVIGIIRHFQKKNKESKEWNQTKSDIMKRHGLTNADRIR